MHIIEALRTSCRLIVPRFNAIVYIVSFTLYPPMIRVALSPHFYVYIHVYVGKDLAAGLRDFDITGDNSSKD